MSGVASWDPSFFLPSGQVWLDGAFLSGITGGGVPPFEVEETLGTFARQTASGSHVFYRPFYGSLSPHVITALAFLLRSNEADDQATFRQIELARSKGSPVDFALGLRIVDTFTATAASVYTLTRRRAVGTVTGVTEVTHPTRIYLDGTLDGTAASLTSQQTITASKSGEIAVEYTPVHYVIMEPRRFEMDTFNDLRSDVALLEVIQGL